MDQEDIKTKIKSSTILSGSEKSEWLFLLPKMTEGQKAELLRILEVRMPVGTREERKNVKTEELRNQKAEKPAIAMTPTYSPPHEGETERGFQPAPIPNTKYDILNTSIEAMRAAPSVYEFFDHLAAKMAVEAKTGKKTREQAMADFQQSPLYRAYVEAGKEMLEGREPKGLTRSEFEAVADFRESLRKILSSA